MKKLLIASTALVATAGMAAAEVTFSGYGRFGVIYEEDRYHRSQQQTFWYDMGMPVQEVDDGRFETNEFGGEIWMTMAIRFIVSEKMSLPKKHASKAASA